MVAIISRLSKDFRISHVSQVCFLM